MSTHVAAAKPSRVASAIRRVPALVIVAWLVAFFVGQTLSTIVLMAAGIDDAETASIPTLFAAILAAWVAYLAGAWWASQRSGTGSMIPRAPREVPP